MCKRESVSGLLEDDIRIRTPKGDYTVPITMDREHGAIDAVNALPFNDHAPEGPNLRRRIGCSHFDQALFCFRSKRGKAPVYQWPKCTKAQHKIRNKPAKSLEPSVRPRETGWVQTTSEKNKPCYRSLMRNLPRYHSPERHATNDISRLNLKNVGNTGRIVRKRFAWKWLRVIRRDNFCLWNGNRLQQTPIGAHPAK